MMSQIQNSKENIVGSDKNMQRLDADSQDFYSSKHEFTQSVLCQVDQMSQHMKSYDNDKDVVNRDFELDSFTVPINLVTNSGENSVVLSKDDQAKPNDTFKHPNILIE